MKSKKGDTLVEVAFAIGIFSLVAITVVAVISASTSAAQAALETTLTREDIDGQAEALRFIHDSYVSGTQSAVTSDNKYKDIWNKIIRSAYDNSDAYSGTYPEVGLRGKSIKEYTLSSDCSTIYNGTNGLVSPVASPGNKTPFIINIRKLNSTNADEVVLTGVGNNKFNSATTYPRILYGDLRKPCTPGGTEQCITEDLYSQTQGGNNNIDLIEGLYVMAVKGQAINVNPATTSANAVAYYDFYIRSCWMPTNSDRPSTISTLVRLYDPAVIPHT